MTELTFTVEDVVPEPYAAAPILLARIRVGSTGEDPVHALALRAQIRIEPQRRRYDEAEERALLGLFGDRSRFAQTLRPFAWLHASTVAPGFTGSTVIDLPLPCTYDFDVAGTTYLHALRDGAIPLLFLFSGTVFTRGTGGFSVAAVPWDREARYALPVAVWRGLMESHFPGTEWVRLGRDAVDALAHFRHVRGLTSWDDAVTVLLAESGAAVPPGAREGAGA